MMSFPLWLLFTANMTCFILNSMLKDAGWGRIDNKMNE